MKNLFIASALIASFASYSAFAGGNDWDNHAKDLRDASPIYLGGAGMTGNSGSYGMGMTGNNGMGMKGNEESWNKLTEQKDSVTIVDDYGSKGPTKESEWDAFSQTVKAATPLAIGGMGLYKDFKENTSNDTLSREDIEIPRGPMPDAEQNQDE